MTMSRDHEWCPALEGKYSKQPLPPALRRGCGDSKRELTVGFKMKSSEFSEFSIRFNNTLFYKEQ